MGHLSKLVLGFGAIGLVSAVGCSDDSDGDGGGDGDGDHSGTGGFVTNTGGSTPGDGDGDVLDPCFGALVYCNNGCADLTSEEANCGSCGKRCGSGELCEDSECVDGPDTSIGGAGGVGGEGGSPN